MIKIAGLQKVTLIDYPGQVAAAVFLAGCNFRCGFCHNPELVEVKANSHYISEQEFFDYLKKRQNVLDGVCVSGGEPLLNNETELIDFLRQIKELGFLIKLDTNGSNPELLTKLIEQKLIDYIAMDIKTDLGQYDQVTKTKVELASITKSINLLMNSGLDYEFRTTVLPKFHDLAVMAKMAKMIKGAKIYYLQRFSNKKTLEPAFYFEPSFKDAELEQLKAVAEKYVKKCEIRS